MRLALAASLLVHLCVLAALPWGGGTTAVRPVLRIASGAIEPREQPEPDPPDPVQASSEPLPAEIYDLPLPEPEAEAIPAMGSESEPTSAPWVPGHYRLRKPLTPRLLSSVPPAEVAPAAAPPPVVAAPQIVKSSQLPPRYPPLALRRAWEGTVVLRIHIDASGAVASVEVHTTSGYGLLDREALRVAPQWRYQPGTRDGRAEAATVLQPVEFHLREGWRE